MKRFDCASGHFIRKFKTSSVDKAIEKTAHGQKTPQQPNAGGRNYKRLNITNEETIRVPRRRGLCSGIVSVLWWHIGFTFVVWANLCGVWAKEVLGRKKCEVQEA